MYRPEGEKGYPWLFFYINRPWLNSFLFIVIGIIGASIFYLWYSATSDDVSPDSIAGYSYAVAGTACLIFALLDFSLRRHSRKRVIGQLNATLNRHVCAGLLGIVLLFMHSFGNFNPRSGTYALYGMIALVISGLIGRTLDRLVPRLIAAEVSKALTAQGEDRIESISQNLQSLVVHNTKEKLHAIKIPGQRPALAPEQGPNSRISRSVLPTSWDLAYITLDETPQELQNDTAQYRFVPERKSTFSRPGALIPGAHEQMSELHNVQQALQREEFFRYIIRYWRIFHIALALLTVGLTLWHLVYALQLLIPTFLPY
jgi:hypothetical protein